MPHCSVNGCSNSGANGFVVHRFPKDEKRRKEWAVNVNRLDEKGNLWIPSSKSCCVICEKHFTKDQYEPRRNDKRLKCNAIPTIFETHKKTTTQTKSSSSSSSSLKTNLPNSEKCDPASKKQHIQLDHAYNCSKNREKDQNDARNLTKESAKGSESSIGVPHFIIENPRSIRSFTSYSYDYVTKLKKQIVTLRREKQMVETKLRRVTKDLRLQSENLTKFLNDDQLKHIKKVSTKGVEWHNDTIKDGLQLWLACGTKGYKALLQKGYPLPTVRTLQRRLRCNDDVQNIDADSILSEPSDPSRIITFENGKTTFELNSVESTKPTDFDDLITMSDS